MYGLRSVRRRHVFLIFATVFLIVFLTNNTNAVHRLRRLDIESIDWSNYEEDIISHVKEELNSIVENPEDFLESKKTEKKSVKIEDNEATTSTEKSTTSATSTSSTSSTISSSESSSSQEKTEKKIVQEKSRVIEKTEEKEEQPINNEKKDEKKQQITTHLSEQEQPPLSPSVEEKNAQEQATIARQKALENIRTQMKSAKMPERSAPPWVYPTIPAPGEKKNGPPVVAKRFVVKKYLNATNIHIFYRSLPEKTEQRRLLRAYMQMWMSVNSDESMLPMNYSIISFGDEKTKEESERFGDLHLCSRNSSELEEYTLLMKAVDLASEMNLNETEVAIFAYTTDLVDSSEIRSATGKLAAIDSDGQKNIICFKSSSRDTNHYSGCGEMPVFALRGDVVKLYAKEMEIIKPYMGSIEERRIGWLTGIVRVRTKIEGLGVNQDNHNLIQMPFELEPFKDFYEENYDWGMDRKPRKLMDYDLPEIYRKPAEWKIELEIAPSCDPSPYLYLVKTSRTNIERRNFLRAFQEFDKNSTKIENLPQMRFLLGKGKASEDPIVEESIQKEMKKHGDMVIGKFIDEYDNLPHKTMTGYTYFANHCMKPHKKQFVMFIDDDVLLDVEHLDSYFKSPNASDFTCFGFLGEHARPNRWGKYNVTIEQWAGGHFFPKFCSGPCAGMTAQMGEKIYEAASTTDAKGFKLEDVLFTGVIRTKAGIPEPSFQKDVCKHFDQKTKQATQMSMWQYIRVLCTRRKYMSTIQGQESLARAFGLDPNNYVHHKLAVPRGPPGVSGRGPPIIQRGIPMVKPVAIQGKIEKAIYRKPDLSNPGVYQAPKPEEKKSAVSQDQPRNQPPPREDPFAGKNIRVAGKS